MDAAKLIRRFSGQDGKYRVFIFKTVKSAKIGDGSSTGLYAVFISGLHLSVRNFKMLPFKVPGCWNILCDDRIRRRGDHADDGPWRGKGGGYTGNPYGYS